MGGTHRDVRSGGSRLQRCRTGPMAGLRLVAAFLLAGRSSGVWVVGWVGKHRGKVSLQGTGECNDPARCCSPGRLLAARCVTVAYAANLCIG